MKRYSIFRYAMVAFMATFLSCKKDNYDPIGNNKPLPVLKLSANVAMIPGTGGSIPIEISSNADKFAFNPLASWLSGSYGNKAVTVTAAANTDEDVRESYLSVSTVTGQSEAQSALRAIQGGAGMQNIFVNMFRSSLSDDWKVLKPNGDWKISDNALMTNSPGDVQSVMAFTSPDAETVRSSTRRFRLSVDVKNDNAWSGVVFHATDDQNFYYIGLNINPTSLFVIVDRIYNGGGSPMAMDPGIALSASRDAYLRCEIVTTTDNPDQFTLNVYELKTTGDISMNTDMSVKQKLAYTRTFTNSLMASGGYAGVWGKVGGGSFRRFVLTTN
jgi:hypothetical protein